MQCHSAIEEKKASECVYALTYQFSFCSFISAKRRLSDSSSNDVSNEMKSEQTKVTILNDQTDSGRIYLPFIYTYSKVGFTIGKNKVIGSVALFPGGILSWKVNTVTILRSFT